MGRHPRGRGLVLRHQGGTVNANHAWWYPEIDTASHGFELVNINCTMDKYAQCWICGASQLRGVPVLVYPATPENSPHGNPVPCDPQGNPVITNANDPRLKEWLANDPRLEDSKVELTFANMAAVGCQPSVQSPDLLSGGKLAWAAWAATRWALIRNRSKGRRFTTWQTTRSLPT